MTELRPAAFLDRDGTLIADRGYLASAAGVELLPGVVDAIWTLNQHGIAVVVVTNQSGIARGLVTEAQYAATRDRLAELLAEQGGRVDGQYHCPHHPDDGCDCRKPNTGLYQRAARELRLNPARSLYVGDRWRDVAPGIAFGGTGILVPSPWSPAEDVERAKADALVAGSLREAVERFVASL